MEHKKTGNGIQEELSHELQVQLLWGNKGIIFSKWNGVRAEKKIEMEKPEIGQGSWCLTNIFDNLPMLATSKPSD